MFDGYVGRYGFSKDDILTVTRDGNRLFEQHTGELRVEVYPEGPRDYFCRIFDEQLSFKTDARGRATALVYTQNGKSRRAVRLN